MQSLRNNWLEIAEGVSVLASVFAIPAIDEFCAAYDINCLCAPIVPEMEQSALLGRDEQWVGTKCIKM
jgi:hypothetical protein